MNFEPNSDVRHVKGRIVLISIAIPFLLVFLDEMFGLLADYDMAWHWYELSFYYLIHLMTLIWLWIIIKMNGVNIDFWKPIDKQYMPGAIKLTLFSLVFAMAAIYAVFYPLSVFIPEFVTFWLIDTPPIIYWADGSYPILANALNLISLCLLAPFIEELIFRGLLLHRWSQKWNTKTAILVSSLIFAILHADPLGAFVFAVAMCLIYIRSGSLWLPIICHGLHNLLIWLFELFFEIKDGPNYEYTLQTFQSEWPMGFIAGLVVVIWTVAYLKKTPKQSS